MMKGRNRHYGSGISSRADPFRMGVERTEDMNELDIQALPLLPLTTGVVLPGMVVTLTIESDEARAAVGATAEGDDALLLTVPRVEGRYARVGVVAKIEDVGRMRNGVEAVVIRGLRRATVGLGVPGTGEATWVQIEPADEPVSDRAHELGQEYRGAVEAITDARGVPAVAEFLRGVTDPGQLADTSGYSPDLSFEQKVEVLETLDVEARLEKVLRWAKETLAEVQVKERIRDEVAGSLEERQRELLLREQMAAIRKELGEDGTEDVLEEYRTKIADAGMPEDVRAQADRELGRLERTSEQSPEYGWIRTYLDWLLDVPWSAKTDDNLDISDAREVLDADHEGLRDVKDRILEYLAVRKLRAERGLVETGGRGSGAILTLVGPPGVGKTSLGESVARALGRKFVRVSLGGVHDESEIRGHRRTYVGALPGRIVRALKDAGTKNPVMMLDEVDKVGADWRGDPSSALLEVLDPAQNHTFRDHYLDVDLDLSEVLFIATANVAETIAGPLLDRMEVIRIDGYTEDEKVAIARRHLPSLRPGPDAAVGGCRRRHSASFYVYNTREDVDALIVALEKARASLALDELYKEVILDHYKNPRNKREMPDAELSCSKNNPLCGDEITVFVHEDDGKLLDVSFLGQGCSISQSSASMMTEAAAGKTRAEVGQRIGAFRGMMAGEVEADEDAFGELVALKGVVKYPVRVKCAVLAWDVLQEALDSGGEAEGSAPH